eukprot:TRINITY_DN10431_c0_g1_i1.p1 TRINITY_DN10431_c0_g1~~TRINITY_DN10431_c0_g1_i1.p1  ORF type:complete len:732 (+),score=143.62 TRINITY_DN10431_c0_g1_i1:158-2197(+)
MTLAEKTAQMNQMAIGEFLTDNQFDEAKARAILSADQIGSLFGSFTYETGSPTASEHRAVLANIQAIALEYGPTPILFAIDSVHGANFINGATIFPQQINVGASFNRALAREMGRITAKDTRAAAVLWDFAPILDLAFHPLFPRIYESFGEDPILVAELAAAMIEGLQGTGLLSDPSRVAACMKHFIAYGTSFTGHDRVPSTVSDRFLNQYHVPPFQRAIDVGVATAMEAYTEINGVPVVSSAQYLEVLLRENMKFQGTLVTDFSEIKNLVYFHRAASSEKSATKLSISQTSVDISMVPADTSFARYLTELVEDGEISESRIDQSVAHILQLKEDLGLFEDPFSESSIPLIPSLGQAEDRAVALRIAQESIVLSQNRRNVLPLRFEKNTEKRTERIVILGPASHSLRLQSGGWTIRWQGADNDEQFPFGVTLYDAFLSGFPETQFFTVCDASENSPINQTELELALLAVSECDVVIFAFAEEPYAEVLGHIKDPALPSSQRQLLDVVSAALPPPASPSRPAVLAVVFEGRPRLLTDVEAAVDAILVAWLPGPEGGQAVYDIIVGNVNPSARMPLTYHGNRAAYPLPYFHRFYEVSAAAGVQYEFGSGLSYSDFAYDSLTLNASIVTPSDRVEVAPIHYIYIFSNKHARQVLESQTMALMTVVTVFSFICAISSAWSHRR